MPRTKTELTAAQLREVLSYDPETGEFRWLVNYKSKRIGAVAGCPNKKGYCYIQCLDRKYSCHRLAWLYVTGKWPPDQLDHVNGDRADNRWNNLRPATQSQNNMNSRGRRDGLKGAYRASNKWEASIAINKTRRFLGKFSTEEEAHDAYCSAANALFGEFARTG